MRLDITVGLEKYKEGSLSVTAAVSAAEGAHDFTLSALAAGTGLAVRDWSVEGGPGGVAGERVTVTGTEFRLAYTVAIPHKVCLGTGKETDLLYPFLNNEEIFFGTGILPIPAQPCTASLRLTGLPPGWGEFSSLTPGGMHAQKLPAFFCYCAPGLAPAGHTWRGREREVAFRVLVQRGKSLPMPEAELFAFFDRYMDRLERDLAPYRRAREINFLILQPPADFEALAGGRTFATGENVLNGIVCYSPKEPDYVEKRFGYASYARFLYEGLAHELLHFYTSMSFDASEKTVLYPAPDCPAYASHLLAEALNLYFCSQYAGELVPEARGSFEAWLERCSARRSRTGAPQPLLDLRELDGHLHASGSSLLALFRELLLVKLEKPGPYSSAAFLFDTMRGRLGVAPPPELEKAILSRP
jgi:hypothetical protein